MRAWIIAIGLVPGLLLAEGGAIEGVDWALSRLFGPGFRPFELKDPLHAVVFHCEVEELKEFAKKYARFSDHALVGTVTESQEDVEVTAEILRVIGEKIGDWEQRMMTAGEMMSKVLAYRNLLKGRELLIPSAAGNVGYVVDRVFDLWNGMPAFGLVPKEKGSAPAILLYRGTDFSFTSKKSWASVITDLDGTGAGYSLFNHAREEIRKWMQEAGPTQVVGTSLGGALTAYTVLNEREWISETPSLAFNPVGVSDEAWKRFQGQSLPLKSYIVDGDLVSKIWNIVGEAYLVILDRPLHPIAAHVTLFTAEPTYRLYRIALPNNK